MKTKLGSFFVTGDNGDRFVTLKDERPEWLQDAVHEAHFSDMPNDWIYAECEAACDAIDDGLFEDRYWQDHVSEHADGRVDVYTKALYQWAADMCHSETYSSAESTARDLMGGTEDSEKRIAIIQYCAIEAITNVMIEAWKEHENDDETEEETEEPTEAETEVRHDCYCAPLIGGRSVGRFERKGETIMTTRDNHYRSFCDYMPEYDAIIDLIKTQNPYASKAPEGAESFACNAVHDCIRTVIFADYKPMWSSTGGCMAIRVSRDPASDGYRKVTLAFRPNCAPAIDAKPLQATT